MSSGKDEIMLDVAPVGGSSSPPPRHSEKEKLSDSSKPSSSFGKTLLLILLSPLILVVGLLVLILVLLYVLLTFPFLLADTFAKHPSNAYKDPIEVGNNVSLPPSESFIRSSSGVYLRRKVWATSEKPSLIVYLIHGFGEHVDRTGYNQLASKLNKLNIQMFGIDHQGHGLSQGARAHFIRLNDVVLDLKEALISELNQYSGVPFIIYGHSMGGLLGLLLSAQLSDSNKVDSQTRDLFKGAIFSSAAALVDEAVATPAIKFAAKVLSFLAPKLELDGVPASFVSRNTQAVDVYNKDPLVHHGGARARLAAEMLKAQEELSVLVPKINVPALILHGSDDKIVPLEASKRINSWITTEHVFKVYEGAYHEVIEDEEYGATYQDDIIQFASKFKC